MPKKIWRVYVNYGEGNGWVPVSWAPTFPTEAEANEWINGDHDWESPVEAQEEEVDDPWDDYQAPYYLETEYVKAMAELIQTDDPEVAEAKLEECWIGTFQSDTEMAEHIANEVSAEYDLNELLTKNPIGVSKEYVVIDYERFARDLLMGDVEVLYNLDGIDLTYIWSRY